jgi:hypothetical protein
MEDSVTGMKTLQEFFLSDNNVQMLQFPLETKYERCISEEPLPAWWNPFERGVVFFDDRKLRMKDRFRREITALKRLGFNDEAVILMALKQSAGNVPQAARILIGRETR